MEKELINNVLQNKLVSVNGFIQNQKEKRLMFHTLALND